MSAFDVFFEEHKKGAVPISNHNMNVFDPWTFFTFMTYFKGEADQFYMMY